MFSAWSQRFLKGSCLLLAYCRITVVGFQSSEYRKAPPRTAWVQRTERHNQRPFLSKCFKSQLVAHSDDNLATPQSTSLSSESQAISAAAASNVLSPWESWCVMHLEQQYEQALSIKCPFFRRRAADVLDATDMVVRFLIIRHKTLQPPGWRCEGDTSPKQTGMSLSELMETIRNDWCCETNKGYYITGRLTTAVYRDDCLFDGPDPDMPVRGLRKYLNAASQLFDQRHSRSELLDLQIDNTEHDTQKIVARWRMKGILRLPWRPAVPEWTGTTTYFTDDDGLIFKHQETWDVSVVQAFLQTLWPECAERIYGANVSE